MRRSRPLAALAALAPCVALCLALCLALAPRAAQASEGEHELWLGVDGTSTLAVGPSARYRYALSDFWAIGGTLQHRFGAESAALADARLTIDALTFVPSLSVGAGAAWRGALLPVGRVVGALAWRPARTWALALRVGVEQVGLEGAPRPFVGLAFGWIRGGAGALDF